MRHALRTCAYLEGHLVGAAPGPRPLTPSLRGWRAGSQASAELVCLALSSESVLWPRIHHQQPQVCSPRGAQQHRHPGETGLGQGERAAGGGSCGLGALKLLPGSTVLTALAPERAERAPRDSGQQQARWVPAQRRARALAVSLRSFLTRGSGLGLGSFSASSQGRLKQQVPAPVRLGRPPWRLLV